MSFCFPWELDSYSVSQEILFLCHPNDHNHIHKILPLKNILCHLTLIYIFTTYFWKILFTVIYTYISHTVHPSEAFITPLVMQWNINPLLSSLKEFLHGIFEWLLRIPPMEALKCCKNIYKLSVSSSHICIFI